MKQIFTTICLALASSAAMATDYTDVLTVSINGMDVAQQQATIVMDQQENGLYTLRLDNFMLGAQMPVGNILLTDVPATQNGETADIHVTQQVAITPGTLPGLGDGDYLGPMLGIIPICVNGEMRGSELYAIISIDLTATLGQNIVCTFGTGGYQLKNSGFEYFHTATMSNATSDEPNNWHSFMSCSGAYGALVGTVPHTFISNDVRPGTLGTQSVLIKSGMVFGVVVANGTLTTGRLQAGAMVATDPKNCSFTDPANTDADANGDPFFAPFHGQPDSLVVWVKFKQETPQTEHPYATINAVLIDGNYYQDPENKTYDNFLAKATYATIQSHEGEWQRLSIPFVYEEGRSLNPQYMHVTMSTNADAGQGTGSDSLIVDDVMMVYNCGISSLKLKGQELTPVAANTYEADLAAEVSAEDIAVVTNGRSAKSEVSLMPMEGGVKAEITVTAGDLKSTQYQLLIKGASLPTSIKGITEGGSNIGARYNLNGQRISDNQHGLVIERSAKGVRKVVRK